MKYALLLIAFPFVATGISYRQITLAKLPAKAPAAEKTRLQVPRKPLLAPRLDSGEPVMQRAWYEYSTDGGAAPAVATSRFVILADNSRKAVDFISEMEQVHRQQSISPDTSYLYLTGPWRGQTAAQKQARIAREQKARGRQADSLHALNNQGHTLIWLVNNSPTPVVLGTQDRSVFCVLQALDRNKQWRPVQYWQFSGCGNSYVARYLRPKETLSLLAKIPATGDFKTKLRYKLAGIEEFYYSNEFAGRISYSEFAEPPGRYGRSATGQLVATFKLDSLPRHSYYGGRRAFPFHRGGKWGDSLPY